MWGPNTPGTLVILTGSILLLISTLSTPIIKNVYFLSANVQGTVSTVLLTGNLKLGVFGYCVELGTQKACSRPKLGYDLEPGSLVSLPVSDLGVPNSLIRAVTYALILHPIAAGLAFLSAVSGVMSHIREYSRSCFTSCLASMAAAVALLAFVLDIVAFSIARSKINGSSNNRASAQAVLGNAVWITLGGWVSLAISTCFFLTGQCLIRKKVRNQNQSEGLRPGGDAEFANEMRLEAAEAEKARREFKPSSGSTRDNASLPAFAEYEQLHAEHIPLNRIDDPPEEDAFSDQSLHRRPPSSERVHGVGTGVPNPRAHPPHPSARTRTDGSVTSHSSYPASPSVLSDIYQNLPPHVTPALDHMNHRPAGSPLMTLYHPAPPSNPNLFDPFQAETYSSPGSHAGGPYPVPQTQQPSFLPPSSNTPLMYPTYERLDDRSLAGSSIQPGQLFIHPQSRTTSPPSRNESYASDLLSDYTDRPPLPLPPSRNQSTPNLNYVETHQYLPRQETLPVPLRAPSSYQDPYVGNQDHFNSTGVYHPSSQASFCPDPAGIGNPYAHPGPPHQSSRPDFQPGGDWTAGPVGEVQPFFEEPRPLAPDLTGRTSEVDAYGGMGGTSPVPPGTEVSKSSTGRRQLPPTPPRTEGGVMPSRTPPPLYR